MTTVCGVVNSQSQKAALTEIKTKAVFSVNKCLCTDLSTFKLFVLLLQHFLDFPSVNRCIPQLHCSVAQKAGQGFHLLLKTPPCPI